MARRPIEVQGLAQLRRDLRKVDKESVLEVRRTIREGARIVASEAASLSTGRVAAGFRGTTSGTRGVVRNPFLPARFLEYGFHPRGGSTFVEPRSYVGRAIERREGDVINALGDGLDRAARSAGWR